MKQISFDVTGDERELITKIVDRALSIEPDLNRLSLDMDLTACHANGTPLRLAELLAAGDFNFTHDVGGIIRHLDRRTGQLGGCFLPRFAKRS